MTLSTKVPPLNISEDRISAYKDSFQVFDTDGDGTISPQELGSLMRSFGQNPTAAQLDTIMNNIDSDKNGTIDFDEFVGLMTARSKATDSTPDEESDLREAFEYFDKNGDGSINVDELRIVMRNIGVYLTDEELDLMMKEADEDGNGVIDFQEFRRVILLPASAGSEPVRVNN